MLWQVLALSVREAMEQTVASLRAGHVTAGMDIGIHGGHSTDGMCWASSQTKKDSSSNAHQAVFA